MKKVLSIIFLILLLVPSQAQVRFGVRGGYNITHLSADKKLFESSNQAGYYVGPTLKIGLPLGLGFEASALYNQAVAKTSISTNTAGAEDNTLTLKRKTFAVPVNLRMSFGFGENLDVFVFAGPQFDLSLNKNIKDINEDVKEWRWKDSMMSINIGAGITLVRHLELRLNYNIPCGETGTFEWSNRSSYEDAYDTYKAKAGIWQLGAAIYF